MWMGTATRGIATSPSCCRIPRRKCQRHRYCSRWKEKERNNEAVHGLLQGQARKAGQEVDQVRRREMRSRNSKEIGSLSGTRYLWLKNKENLTDEQQRQLELLLSIEHLDTVTACRGSMRIPLTTRVPLKPMNANALLEGFNSMPSLIKHRARGFRNMNSFMDMIYFACGELAIPKASIMQGYPLDSADNPTSVLYCATHCTTSVQATRYHHDNCQRDEYAPYNLA